MVVVDREPTAVAQLPGFTLTPGAPSGLSTTDKVSYDGCVSRTDATLIHALQ